MLDQADAGEEVPEKSLIFGSFSLFSVLFVVSVLTLRPGMYRYQVRGFVVWCGGVLGWWAWIWGLESEGPSTWGGGGGGGGDSEGPSHRLLD